LKFLLYGINFSPELTGIGKYTGELSAWLASQGHEVRVVTAPPYYPAWQVGEGYSAWRWQRQAVQGATVWRCPVWVPARPTGSKRVLHLLSFALASLPVMLGQVVWRPDVVWVCAPAFACTPAALLTARLVGAPAWLHVQDYEIDVAFDTGLLRGAGLRRVITGLERWLLRRFQVVSTISHRMVQRARDKGVAPGRVQFFPNWVDVSAVQPLERPSQYRQMLGLAEGQVVALFSGTLGAKQGLDLIAQAARLLVHRCPQLMFVICGSGVMEPTLRAATADLTNVCMLPLQPKEQVPELLGMADIHLLPQDPGVSDLVMPSKLTAMLSSGRAVLTSATPGSEVAEVVSGCGLLSEPGSAEAFAAALERLAGDGALRQRFGQAARAYAEAHLGTDQVLARFVAQCQALRAGLPLEGAQGGAGAREVAQGLAEAQERR
jgi:colanic acid biosynthesis glycosyl transferase WcaI